MLLPAMSGKARSVLKTEDLLSASPRPVFDVFSYYFYGAASIRCATMGSGVQTTAEAALSEDWLSRADRSYAFYAGLRDRFEPASRSGSRGCGLRRRLVGQDPSGHLPLSRSARALGQGRRERRVSQHARLERVRSSPSEHVRATSKLLGPA